MPKFSKINPLTGLGNVFSKQQLVTAIKNVFLTLILGFIAWLHIRDGVAHVAKLPAQGSPMALAMAGDWILSGLTLLMLVVFIVALIELLVMPAMANMTFFLIVLMTLSDVIAGFTVTISTARRDIQRPS